MAISTSKPNRCPNCGKHYAARVPKRLEDKINLVRMYRCQTKEAVYLHWITP